MVGSVVRYSGERVGVPDSLIYSYEATAFYVQLLNEKIVNIKKRVFLQPWACCESEEKLSQIIPSPLLRKYIALTYTALNKIKALDVLDAPKVELLARSIRKEEIEEKDVYQSVPALCDIREKYEKEEDAEVYDFSDLLTYLKAFKSGTIRELLLPLLEGRKKEAQDELGNIHKQIQKAHRDHMKK